MTTIKASRLRELVGFVNPRTQIWDVRVARCQAEAPTMYSGGPMTATLQLLTTGVQEDPASLEVRAFYDVAAYWTEAPDEVDAPDRQAEPAWRVMAEFVATFEVASGVEPFSEQQLAAFAMSTGAMAIHPYAREFVQATVARLGYPPYTMDFMRSAAEAPDDEDIEIMNGVTPEDVEAP